MLSNNREVSPPLPKAFVQPAKFKAQHAEALYKIGMFRAMIRKEAPKRVLPILRGEMESFGVAKTVLNELEKMGLVMQRLIKVEDAKNNNKPVGARSIVYLTPMGKAFFAPTLQEVVSEPARSDRAPGDGGPVQHAVQPVDEKVRS